MPNFIATQFMNQGTKFSSVFGKVNIPEACLCYFNTSCECKALVLEMSELKRFFTSLQVGNLQLHHQSRNKSSTPLWPQGEFLRV